MNPKPRTYEPAGGDGLFFIISFAIIAVVAVEGLFIAFSSWWLMSAVLLLVIAAAIGVSAALVHLIDNDTAVPTPLRRPDTEPEADTSRTRARAAPARRHALSAEAAAA